MTEMLLCLLLIMNPGGMTGAAGATPPLDMSAAAVLRMPPPWTMPRLPQPEVRVTGHASPDSGRDTDLWLGSDKFRHFLLSYAVTAFTFASLRSAGARSDDALAGGMAGAAVAGLGKEVYDRRRGGIFSGRDLVADAIGITTAYFLLREVR
jgi:uncharacterized protein YfiM (DUF2279 family)